MDDLYHLIESSPLSADEKAQHTCNIHHILQSLTSHESTASLEKKLASIKTTSIPTCIPLASLSLMLAKHRGPWPVLDLIRCHNKLWQAMPEEVKANQHSKEAGLVEESIRQVKSSYQSLASLMPAGSTDHALIDPVSGVSLRHNALQRFISEFDLPITNDLSQKPVVVIAMPNGPQLGLACLAVANYYRAAPLNASGGSEQFRIDVQQSGSKTLLVSRTYLKTLKLDEPWVAESNIEVLIVDPKPDLTFGMTPLHPRQSLTSPRPQTPNGPDDIAFILFTSGTSGTKKLVPLTLHSVVCGVAFVIESWGLKKDDSCLNMMPLNHVGGLVRNLFAPVISGGSTICCSAFDPNLFWDIVEEHSPSWYYASPSMHSTILAESAHRLDAVARNRIRLVCNAAGGLLPSLAIQLRDTFNCTVLPSYGMTECMPISTPPLDYRLDRPGTSGISVGPELAILDPGRSHVAPHTVGHICVRGAPAFPGYLTASGTIDASAFTKSGWFDTGDMGYMDEDGYLYVTGRSKEVINRGGELISPLEVEEAIMKASQDPQSPVYNRIKESLVFSVPHDVLQEVVGVVLVTPPGQLRPDLRQLHEALKVSLHSVKWPVIIVYMDALPKNNNKILRVKLGDRFGFTPFSDTTTLAHRHFEGICPPPDTPLSQPIQQHLVKIEFNAVQQIVARDFGSFLDSHIWQSPLDHLTIVVVAPKSYEQEKTPDYESVIAQLKSDLRANVDGYLLPNSIDYIDIPFPRHENGFVDQEQVSSMIESRKMGDAAEDLPFHEKRIREIFADILTCPHSEVRRDSDFFEMGGDSLKAGRLLSTVRRELNVRVPIEALFTSSSVQSLCELVEDKMSKSDKEEGAKHMNTPLPGCEKTHSSTNPILLLVQLIPMLVVFPMRRALQWTILLYCLGWALSHFPSTTVLTRLVMLLVSVLIAQTVTQIVAPIFGLLTKWILIGRYKEGLYPMWGLYHTRWWLTQKILSVCGKGIFNKFNITRIWYYRLLGAKIGSRVSINGAATLGEYDLLTIGDGVSLDNCICRPFGAERNTTMHLGRIELGNNCNIGLKSIVAPGATVPADTCIGPNSSSWELKDATEANRDLSRSMVPQPHFVTQWFLGWPIIVLVNFVSLGPRVGGLIGLVEHQPVASTDMARSVIIWFASPSRVGYHFLALVLGATFGRALYVFLVIIIKRTMDLFFGKLRPGPASQRSEMHKFRMWLMAALLPGGDVSQLTEYFGSHYDFTSWVVRALGGKVGKRVYWPGHGPSIQDFDLIDIGDDVVFGSRAHIVTSDGIGSERVKIGAGSMVADRVVILPGTEIEENVVLGSGALTRRATKYIKDTVWVGSKEGGAICLTAPDRKESFATASTLVSSNPSGVSSSATSMKGPNKKGAYVDEKMLESGFPSANSTSTNLGLRSEESSIKETESASPFGRAFYEGKANYHVLGLFSIFLYSTVISVIVTVYWNLTTVSTVQVLAAIIEPIPTAFYHGVAKPFIIWGIACGCNAILLAIQAVVGLTVVIIAKWALMRRRQAGSYDWDKSSYCQRWQIYLTAEKLRRQCFGGDGILGMLTGTHYCVLFFRALGATIGKDCALFAGGKPSLMFTEPDLLTLGDRVAVDDASLVAHINSRGNFNLNRLEVGERSVLRSGSRLLSGAHMEADTCLLEHTLVMGGDLVEKGSTYQGWPADCFVGDRVRVS